MSNIEVLQVPARFNPEMMQKYYALFRQAMEARKRLHVYATPEAREKFMLCAASVFTGGELYELIISGYPTSEIQANNLARGMSNAYVLLIDETARYSGILTPTLAASKPGGAMIVSLSIDVER